MIGDLIVWDYSWKSIYYLNIHAGYDAFTFPTSNWIYWDPSKTTKEAPTRQTIKQKTKQEMKSYFRKES